ncbi:ATPase [Egibacter rhizosphaerae]|uniref:ATPase n=1 Tax=Egibacter rhizosphaerae TaxID=1670831 RepID=A0A411YEN6_9ACTN|nr:BadF/BadG/BcrA/BcrD ATPase family protein [Egibacter rhizosphaerae]QBI19685.1 ATPase [Egibacter rhizosphaerae]
MTRVLAFDGGKSHTALAGYVDGRAVARARGPGLAHVAEPGGPRAVREALEATVVAAGLDGQRVDAACLGLTGVHAPSQHAATVLKVLAVATGAESCGVASDVVTTFCGAVGSQPGAVVAGGTGTIALAIDARGATARVDGWGYLLDDAGSGFRIGQQGLRSALRATDGRGGSERLAQLATARYGEPASLTTLVYGSERPAETIAAFAVDVATAAREGDEDAQRIWSRAGAALADALAAAARRVSLDPQAPVSWNGGLFDAGDLLVEPFRGRLAALLPGQPLRPPRGNALDGAYRIAVADEPTLLDPLVQRTPPRASSPPSTG